MRAWLLVCAALAFAPGQPPTATAAHPPPRSRDEHIKTQILAKLGLSTRPTPLRAPPRDVVRKILQRAADPAPAHQEPEHTMREIIAIAHRDICSYFRDVKNRNNNGMARTVSGLTPINSESDFEWDRNLLIELSPRRSSSLLGPAYNQKHGAHTHWLPEGGSIFNKKVKMAEEKKKERVLASPSTGKNTVQTM